MLDWLYTAIAWVMKQWHALFSTFLDPASGITWALSIVFLVVTIRVLLFRLFVKQVKSQRAMQEIQPEIQKLRKQYGSDKQGFSQAMMALNKERGVNPLAGCLPILPQIPIFLSLFHVLRRIAPGKDGLYSWDDTLTDQAASAQLFGAPISSSFNMTGEKEQLILALPGVGYTNIRIVAFLLIVIMCFTTFFTQKQIMRRSGPVEGQAAMVQKLLLYGMPLSLFVSGFFFPIGVLLYWFTNNLWTLGQQFYILKKLPPPGSPAALAKAAADKPQVDPKTLAPKPGAKPVRPKSGTRPASAPPASTVDGEGGAAEVPPAGATPATGDGHGSGGSANGRPPGGGGARPRTGSSGSRSSAGPANRGKRKRR
ncbi:MULTISPECIES: membrane protein insertase YidC [unclassified Modestobacter]|uniref:membrane protein insertase YidC n=1 Tax=unclassified Modestobacter TaxID=2643866 RepID=UPI0022AA34D2|nr:MULTISPECIES: membrane protein insertase YidC [unclassified Modestobacter]MCZ2822991.1 membrane protein insertase YidC [Modestobacter sp. VKM Ac-2981]MCZ2851237.1 membrane protein insertase YidC [Modestobacter sp. VKM Ac-2982]